MPRNTTISDSEYSHIKSISEYVCTTKDFEIRHHSSGLTLLFTNPGDRSKPNKNLEVYGTEKQINDFYQQFSQSQPKCKPSDLQPSQLEQDQAQSILDWQKSCPKDKPLGNSSQSQPKCTEIPCDACGEHTKREGNSYNCPNCGSRLGCS